MKILMLTKHLNLGGISRYILDLSACLKEKGHEVHIASSGGELKEELEALGINHVNIPIDTKSELSLKIWKSLFKLKNFFKKKDVDIVHAHNRVTSVLSFFLSKILDSHNITTTHSIYKNRLNRRLLPFVGEKTIAVSDQTNHRLRNWFEIPEEKIVTIYNGINFKYFKKYSGDEEKLRKRFNLKNGGFIIGNVSRLAEIKGQQILIRSLKKIEKKITNVKLLLVGEGDYKEGLKKIAKEEGVSNRVVFAGGLKDVRPALSIMDIFCFTPLDEPFGISLLEAMVSEVPVVASSVSQIPDILEDGNCGILVESGNIEGVKNAIFMLYNDETRKKRLVGNALDKVKREFSIERMAEQVEKVYQNVTGNK